MLNTIDRNLFLKNIFWTNEFRLILERIHNYNHNHIAESSA